VIVRFDANGVLDPLFGAAQPDSDVYPDAMTLPTTTAPASSANVVSSAITVSGINSRTSVELQPPFGAGRGFSVGCTDTFTTGPDTIEPGQSVCVRHHASSTPLGSITTTITVGGREAQYTTQSTAAVADTTPDAFVFAAQTDVERSVDATSNTVTISGISGVAVIEVVGGQYSLDCTQNFKTTADIVLNGQTVCVRHGTANQFSTTVTTTLVVGGVSAAFSSTTRAQDTTPNAFNFTAQTGVTAGATVYSNQVTIAGIETPVNISVTGGEYSVGCSDAIGFTSQPGTIPPGQVVCVRHVASSSANTSVSTALTVGGVSATFMSTTGAAPPAPPPPGGNGGGGGGGGGSFDLASLAWLALLAFAIRARRFSTRPRTHG
jgi:hypothetical protein